jgi:plastocyanin
MTTGTASRTFSNTGSFSYTCTNHAGMNGTVTVQ